MPPAVLACFAATAPGVEPMLQREITARGLTVSAVEPGGVEFTASPAGLADTLLWLRVANRITVRVATFHARGFGELERHLAAIDWRNFLSPGTAVHFRVTARKSRLYHHDAVAERCERAVHGVDRTVRAVRAAADADALEQDVGRVPEVQRFIVRIFRDEVTISADAAGALLHLRGWRQAVARAPLRETLAAALLAASGWDPALPLCDPFCGSGTIPIEAALIAANIAPGSRRRFAADRWRGMGGELNRARHAALAAVRPVGVAIEGSDRDAGAIEAATANADRAGVADAIAFRRAALSSLEPDSGVGWLITNPPYGSRLGAGGDLRDLYATLGRVARQQRPRWNVAIMGADRRLEAQVGLPWEELVRTTNGGIPVRMLRSLATESAAPRRAATL